MMIIIIINDKCLNDSFNVDYNTLHKLTRLVCRKSVLPRDSALSDDRLQTRRLDKIALFTALFTYLLTYKGGLLGRLVRRRREVYGTPVGRRVPVFYTLRIRIRNRPWCYREFRPPTTRSRCPG